MTLKQYLAHHYRYEALMWVALSGISMIANSIVVSIDLQRLEQPFEWWEPWLWEGSSTLLILCLIPVLLLFDRRFSLHTNRPAREWQRHLLAHIGFSAVFSLLHVGGMVAIRRWGYWLQGKQYDFGHWAIEWPYEYLKDFRTYFTFLVIIYAYKFILRRLQGEASLPGTSEDTHDIATSDRFLIKKLGKEFLIKVDDIDWLEASGNYVTLHANQHMYPLRGTMTNLEQKLKNQGFIRIHRSAMINLNRLSHIEPLESGDARAHLNNGQEVAISRRYRAQLKSQLMPFTES